jgi:hypothetical protein
MQLVARPCIAAAALVTGSVIAATPLAPPALPEVHMPAIHLTATTDGLSQEIADAMASFNAQLGGQELGLNGNLYNGEIGFEKAIGPFFANVADSHSADSALNGVLNRLFNVGNLFLGTGENTFNSLLGANNFTPEAILNTLLTGAGNPANVFDGGNIGGVEGIFDNSAITYGDFIGLLHDQFGLSLPGPTGAQLFDLQNAELGFNTNLVNGETAFNGNLLGSELNFEKMLFGSDSALNGVLNRLFNVGNLFLGTGENTFNSVLGADFNPEQLTASLLTGAPNNIFDSGTIGGLEGMIGQGYMAFADSLGLLGNPAGLLPADLLGAFNPADLLGTFNPADLLGAFNPADLAGILNPLDLLGAFNPLDVLAMLPF